MDRRKFLKQVSLWSAGIIMAPPVFHLTPTAFGSSKKTSIHVAKGKNYTRMVQQVVQSSGGIAAFVKTRDRVVIKPNIGWDRNVEQGANTHPAIVAGKRGLGQIDLEKCDIRYLDS